LPAITMAERQLAWFVTDTPHVTLAWQNLRLISTFVEDQDEDSSWLLIWCTCNQTKSINSKRSTHEQCVSQLVERLRCRGCAVSASALRAASSASTCSASERARREPIAFLAKHKQSIQHCMYSVSVFSANASGQRKFRQKAACTLFWNC
jgi:hypothetical protein